MRAPGATPVFWLGMIAPLQMAELVTRSRSGDALSTERLFQLLYDELLGVAHRQRLQWNGDFTLDTRALVHESYFKFVRQDASRWGDRQHFLSVAARAMRQVLVSYAERRRAAKRGGGAPDTTLLPDAVGGPDIADDILDLHEALGRLATEHPRLAQVVDMRFLVGLSVEEAAEAMGVSEATIKRDWVMARAWLLDDLRGGCA